MKLPTELRNKIYYFALHHILDTIHDEAPAHERLWRPIKKSRSDPDSVPFYSGALALTHTNRVIRTESLDTLASCMIAHVDRLEDEVDDIATSAVLRFSHERHEELDLEALQAAFDTCVKEEQRMNKLSNSAVQVNWICNTMGWTKGG